MLRKYQPWLPFVRTLLLVVGLFSTGSVLATSIVIQNSDGAGEGFNDATVVTPVGGNSGTTLGQQRLNVFADAASVWSALVDSSITIVVDSNFDPLSCTSTQAILGGASTTTLHRDFSNAPVSNTWYPAALADSHANSNLNGSTAEIVITFNSDIDNNNNCLNGINWYYGLDGNPPGNDVDLRTVVLHEIAHGLGFATYVDTSNGYKFGSNAGGANGRDDIFMITLEDHSLGLQWPAMSNAQRVASAIDNGDLHWTGTEVLNNSGGLTAGVSGGHVEMYAPTTLQGGSSVSHFSTALFPNELMEPSITGPQAGPGLAVSLMDDIGWTILTPINSPPTISTIASQNLNEDTTSAAIPFTIGDVETATSVLIVTAVSSNTGVVQNSGLVLGGSDANRTLTITPVAEASGTTTITVTVSDGEDNTDSPFGLTVVAVNDPPQVTISTPANLSVFIENDLISFSATATDVEDGNLGASIQWSSDLDGIIGNGASLMVASLTIGVHSISADVVDSGSSPGSDFIQVTVIADADTDGDGMADAWELDNFGTLDRDGTGDFDNDGITDLQEYLNFLDTNNGDINEDGLINVVDLLLAEQHVLGIILLTQDQIDGGDVYPPTTGDGVLDISDIILIEQIILGL